MDLREACAFEDVLGRFCTALDVTMVCVDLSKAIYLLDYSVKATATKCSTAPLKGRRRMGHFQILFVIMQLSFVYL